MNKNRRSLLNYRGTYCRNCAAKLEITDVYCHACGQVNSIKKLAIKDFFAEFFANTFSYDSRIWRTVRHLLFKPGYVSKQYILGKRTSYANPFRFFFSVCLIFFLLVQTTNFIKELYLDKDNSFNTNNDGIITINGDTQIEPNTRQALEQLIQEDSLIDIQIKKLEKNRFTKSTAITLESEKKKLTLKIDTLKKLQEKGLLKETIPFFTKQQITFIKSIDTTKVITTALAQQLDDQGNFKYDVKKDQVISQKTIDRNGKLWSLLDQLSFYIDINQLDNSSTTAQVLKNIGHKNTTYNRSLYERAKLLNTIQTDPQEVLNTILLSKLPLFLFLFTPLIAFFIGLLYLRHPFNYMEHMVFIFNITSFVFISAIILKVLQIVSFNYINLAPFFFLILGPFYTYKSMRKFYDQRRIKTIIKFILLNFVYVMSMIIGLAFLFLIGIAMN